VAPGQHASGGGRSLVRGSPTGLPKAGVSRAVISPDDDCGSKAAVRHRLFARALPRPRTRSPACLSGGEADDLARQIRVDHAENRRFPRSRRGSPYLPRDRLGEPPYAPHFADRSDSCCEAACRSVSCLPTAQTRPGMSVSRAPRALSHQPAGAAGRERPLPGVVRGWTELRVTPE